MQYQRKHNTQWHDEYDDSIQPSEGAKVCEGMDLDRALALLPPRMRLCLVLSYHERMSHAEIKKLTGMNLGTVKKNIRRGSKKLREQLADYGDAT